MNKDFLRDLNEEHRKLEELFWWLNSDYSGVTQGRLQRIYEACDTIKEIIEEIPNE